eukprot:6600148-Karenia_brevis.AAC.1
MYDAIHGNTSRDEQKDKTPFEISKAHRASSTGQLLGLQRITQPMQTPVPQRAEAGLPASSNDPSPT